MAEPFKNLINAALVQARRRTWRARCRASTANASRNWPADGLEALEMKARALQICRALEATLPADFDTAATA
jgi:hypothetical protein